MLSATSILAQQVTHNATTHQGAIKPIPGEKQVIYTCPMHPDIHSPSPGSCPKCGMELVQSNTPVNKSQVLKSPPSTDLDQKEQRVENRDSVKKVGAIGAANQELATTGTGYTPKIIRYDLYVKDTIVNYTGKARHAIAINGTIPAPTLEFTEGDTAQIVVHNLLNKETSLHWHGIILPNQEDGVSYLTTAPIRAGETHQFVFPVVQTGTYWYHSHTKVQEQSGMYGALVFHERKKAIIPEYTVVLSDWTNMYPGEVERSLHSQTDWFSIKKNSTQSYAEAAKDGYFKTKFKNEWMRMLAMDVSDVAYDRFLINGQAVNQQPQFRKGDKVRLRIVNGSSSTYFWLKFAAGKITVVANDGKDVEPIEVDRLIIAVAETYDVIVTIPEDRSYEFLVTPEDRTKRASLWLGNGMKMPADTLPRLRYFKGMKMMNSMMKMNGDLREMDGMEMYNQVMDMNIVMYPEMEKNRNVDAHKGTEYGMDMAGMEKSEHVKKNVTLNYNMLRSPEKTALPVAAITRVFYFNLTGNMNRYVWTIDNKTVSEAGKIFIKKGENIRIILYNNTMMRHPMHLHGHFFRVLNGQGDYSPLKNTLDIMPMERDTLEFAATESGDWFFHCHILYHMMSGMGRVFSYENSPLNSELPNKALARRKLSADDRMFHGMAKIGLESNGSDGEAMLANTRWKLGTMWHLGSHAAHGYESETNIGRYLGKMQWWYVYAGFDYHHKVAEAVRSGEKYNLLGQLSNKNNRATAIVGVQYLLPLLVVADARIDGEGKMRIQLSREGIPVSKRLRFNFMMNTDKEYMAGFRYIITKYFSVSTHYDSDMGLGAGITITY